MILGSFFRFDRNIGFDLNQQASLFFALRAATGVYSSRPKQWVTGPITLQHLTRDKVIVRLGDFHLYNVASAGHTVRKLDFDVVIGDTVTLAGCTFVFGNGLESLPQFRS